MIEPLERATLFALYQLTIALGIVLLPVALLTSKGGVTPPIHRLVERVERAYETTAETP